MTEDQRQILDQMSELKQGFARVEATLEAHLARTRDELNALFAIRKNHEARLSEIERSYVPAETCERLHRETAERFREATKRQESTEGQVTAVRLKLATLVGGTIVVSTILSMAGNILASWLKASGH